MKEFVFGTAAQFDWLEALLAEGVSSATGGVACARLGSAPAEGAAAPNRGCSAYRNSTISCMQTKRTSPCSSRLQNFASCTVVLMP